MSREVGQLYWIYMAFEDDPNDGKDRPVAILDKDEKDGSILALVLEITTKGPTAPPKPYDQCKVPILDWKQAGLYSFSYGKVNKSAAIDETALLDDNYIGTLSPTDLQNLQHSLALYHQSNYILGNESPA